LFFVLPVKVFIVTLNVAMIAASVNETRISLHLHSSAACWSSSSSVFSLVGNEQPYVSADVFCRHIRVLFHSPSLVFHPLLSYICRAPLLFIMSHDSAKAVSSSFTSGALPQHGLSRETELCNRIPLSHTWMAGRHIYSSHR